MSVSGPRLVSVPNVWSAEQVLALAPDASSASAGRKLSAPGPWSDTGATSEPGSVWGLCKGSGKTPYRTSVDLSGPAYSCSCPSRKFPCKHALGLLLLWSAGRVDPGPPPEWVQTWLTSRAERAAQTAPEAPAKRASDPEAAAKRVEQRTRRVTAGLAELDTWLADQVRGGLAGLERAGYAHFDAVAARMVDAQAPGLANRLRRLPSIVAGGEGWPLRLLEELAMLRLITAGHSRLDSLPEALAASVRREVGYPAARGDVLASAPVRDQWQVLGMRDDEDDRLTTRRVWLHGEATGRMALVLSFAPAGGSLDATLFPGSTVDADVHFYEGAAPLRALVGVRHGEPGPLNVLTGSSLEQARRGFANAIAADPWVVSWPVVVAGLTPLPATAGWVAVDEAEHRVPLLAGSGDLWSLVAVSGGHAVTVAGEFSAAGLRPLSAFAAYRLVSV
jgi:hypothetical protein